MPKYKCKNCGWEGAPEDCNHQDVPGFPPDDVDTIDFCPSCGSDDLEVV